MERCERCGNNEGKPQGPCLCDQCRLRDQVSAYLDSVRICRVEINAGSREASDGGPWERHEPTGECVMTIYGQSRK